MATLLAAPSTLTTSGWRNIVRTLSLVIVPIRGGAWLSLCAVFRTDGTILRGVGVMICYWGWKPFAIGGISCFFIAALGCSTPSLFRGQSPESKPLSDIVADERTG